MTLPLQTVIKSDCACDACRNLIHADAVDPNHVDWFDLQAALVQALAAFGLPSDYFDALAQFDANT